MSDMYKIEAAMFRDPIKYNEFIQCYYNRGKADMAYGYKDDNNFWFRRSMPVFNMNEIYISFDDSDYLCENLQDKPELNSVTCVYAAEEFDTSLYENTWKVFGRRQFTMSEPQGSNSKAQIEYFLINSECENIINKSESERVRQNYTLSIGHEDTNPCYAAIKNGILVSFLSISILKLEQIKIAEINWIYTETAHRRKGYAGALLSGAANTLLNDGCLVTYHCAETNVASANTAISSGMIETTREICFTK